MTDVDVQDKQELVESEAAKAVVLQRSLIEATQAIRALQASVDEAWERVESSMIENDIKSIRHEDWGSITIAERLGFDIDMAVLPRTYKKLVPDTTLISSQYRLTGKAPKGAAPKTTKYLTKRLKGIKHA